MFFTFREIDNDSFEMLDESNGIFNTISASDVNDAQKELKEKMEQRAVEKGILDIAKNNVETLVAELLNKPNRSVQYRDRMEVV